MIYKELKVVYKDAKDRLNRELLIREDVSLIELGLIIGNSFYCTFDHDFMFKTSGNSYVSESYGDVMGQTLYMSDFSFNDLGNHFEFIYDFGEEWCFDCEVVDSRTKRGKQFAYALDGNGAGIFEDGRIFYEDYLNGDFDIDIYAENIDENYVPYNIPFAFLENPDYFDLEEMNHYFKHILPFDIFEYIEDSHDMGLEEDVQNIKLEDYLSKEEIDEYYEEGLDVDETDSIILQKILVDAVTQHITKLDYVSEAYDRLVDKYNDPMYATLRIMDVLLSEVKDVLSGDSKSLDGEYKNKIKGLK